MAEIAENKRPAENLPVGMTNNSELPETAPTTEFESRVEIVKRGKSVIILNKKAIESCNRPKSAP